MVTCIKELPNLNIPSGLDELLHLGIEGGDNIGGDGPRLLDHLGEEAGALHPPEHAGRGNVHCCHDRLCLQGLFVADV